MAAGSKVIDKETGEPKGKVEIEERVYNLWCHCKAHIAGAACEQS